MLADIERAEKELDHANRKIKQFEEAMKKLKIENEQLRNSKKNLNDDLQKLLARRTEIENLRTTIVGLIQNSSSRKIDVDDLKSQLAATMRQQRYQAEASSPVRREKEAILRKGNTGKSRSRSRGQPMTSHSSNNNEALNLLANQRQSFDGANKSNSQTMKMYDGSDETAVPAWYKTLKKNIVSK